MLDIVVPLRWTESAGPWWTAQPFGPLPDTLRYYRLDEWRHLVHGMSPCPCCGNDMIRLRAGWVYSEPGILVFDAPARYCPAMDRIFVLAEDRAEAAARLAGLQGGRRVSAAPERLGVGGAVVQRRFGARVCEVLRISERDDAFICVEGDVLTVRDTDLRLAPALPDALAFHTDGPPEKITLTVEATTRCNFRCGFCYGRHLEQGAMTWEAFLTVLDRLPGLQAVEFTGEGEPVVNRYLFDMLEECRRRGLWTHLTSNGSLLTEERIERLLSMGLSSLAISLESLDAARFARLRPGGDLATVIKTLRRVHRLRRQRNVPLEMRLWVTLLRETLDEVEEIVRFARSLEIDHVEFQALNGMDAYSRFYSPDLRLDMLTLKEMRELIESRGVTSGLRAALESIVGAHAGRRCDIFMSAVMVYWNGVVTPCRLLKVPDHPPVGNLVQDSFNTLWQQEAFRVFRFSLQHGIVMKSCYKCANVASA